MGLYENVRNAAKVKGYSVNRLEQELGFARSYIAKFKTITPSADKIQKIANFLDVSSEYLLTGKEANEDDGLIKSRDLKQEYDKIYKLLKSGEYAPLYFDGQPADKESIDLLMKQVEISLAIIEKDRKGE